MVEGFQHLQFHNFKLLNSQTIDVIQNLPPGFESPQIAFVSLMYISDPLVDNPNLVKGIFDAVVVRTVESFVDYDRFSNNGIFNNPIILIFLG